MIFPSPADLKSYERFPLTGVLVLLNIVIFVLIFSEGSGYLANAHSDQPALSLTGRLYYQHLQGLSAEELYLKPEWLRSLRGHDEEQLELLGYYALRDGDFFRVADQQIFKGDQVQIAAWQKDLVNFRNNFEKQQLFRYGLSGFQRGPLLWITYQFSHSNWVHLFSNLIFLVLLGAAVEELAGSATLLLVYLIGGAIGGLGFILSDLHGVIPVVGASASISALMTFYCFTEHRRRVRYWYFVSPLPGQYGSIFLPTLLIIPLFVVVDIAKYWSTPDGFGAGVAYVAHLGGGLAGLVLALLYRIKASSFLTES